MPRSRQDIFRRRQPPKSVTERHRRRLADAGAAWSARSSEIVYVNPAAEQFFDIGARPASASRSCTESDPLRQPADPADRRRRAERGASVGERDVDLSTPRHGERIADVTVTPLPEPEGTVIVTLAGAQPRAAHRPPTAASRRGALACTAWRRCWRMRSRIRWPAFAARRNCSKKRCRPSERELTQLICAETRPHPRADRPHGSPSATRAPSARIR